MKPVLPALYSYQWAMGVVQKLIRTYPRATDISMKILDLTKENLAAYLAHGDPVFPRIRDLIHVVDKLENRYGQEWVMSNYSSFLSRYYQRIFPGRLMERLTAIQPELIIEEQVKQVGKMKPKAESSLPSFPGNSEEAR